ncbi:MAG: hypothetical protein SWY16_05690 [Cyanobacteriota bacterium]|nr:hypothetical protein [Cyanobacteriota bacterium]
MLLAYTRLFGWNPYKTDILEQPGKPDRFPSNPKETLENRASKNTVQTIQKFQQVYHLERRLFL